MVILGDYGAVKVFPASLEVDRELYIMSLNTVSLAGRLVRFPAPREVGRELYILRFQFTDPVPTEFPAPTEVDR